MIKMCYCNKLVFLCISLFIITSVIGVENQIKPDSSVQTSLNKTKNQTKESLLNNPKKKIVVAEGLELSPQDFPTENIKHNVNKKDEKTPASDNISIDLNEHTTKSGVVARKGVIQPDQITTVTLNKNESNILNTSTENSILNSSKLNEAKNKTQVITTEKSIITTKKPFKPKPTATGDDDVDQNKPFPSLPTKTPPIGMPSKINYVVPVVLTILVGTFFIIFVLFLYKNGREYWEKRHYRRMDFLIDGMYNE